MRLPTVAICTLAALVAGILDAKANPSESQATPYQQSVTSDWSVPTSSVDSDLIERTGREEILAEQPSSQLDTEVAAPPTDDSISQSSITDANQPVAAGLPAETSEVEAQNLTDFVAESSSTEASQLQELQAQQKPELNPANCIAQARSSGSEVAQATNCPRPEAIPPLRVPEVSAEYESSPGLSIYIPVGFGLDSGFFLSGTYQATTREDNDDDNNGAFGVGFGLGDADKAVGLELSYVFDDFNDDFPDGGFNAKLHRRFGDVGIAAGYNGFANIGRNDYEHSRYGVITGIIRTQPSVRQPFSRISITAGVGDGQFRSNGAIDADENAPNVFGNVAFRVFEPVSAIVEWTGVDLAAGLSIAPIRNFPWVITPAVRDIVGAGDEPRFVLGTGFSFRF